MKTHLNSPITESVVNYFYSKNALIGCICAAPSILGKYGYLENKKFTCFPSFEKLVIGGTYLADAKVVVDGNIITSKAAGTTFEFAYEITKYLRSESIANHIKEAVFYN
jgi:putative intracellular protease/amidase